MQRMAGQAKGITDFLGVKPEYGMIGSQGIADQAREVAAITAGNALATNAGLKARADMAAAEHYADATIAAGQAQRQTLMSVGIASSLCWLAGGIGKLGGGGSSSFGNSGFGSFGNYSGGLSGTPIPGMFG